MRHNSSCCYFFYPNARFRPFNFTGQLADNLVKPIRHGSNGGMGFHKWGKWGQLTPWKMGEKLKCENMQKSSFYVYVIFLEQSGQADVENGAMLTIFIQI